MKFETFYNTLLRQVENSCYEMEPGWKVAGCATNSDEILVEINNNKAIRKALGAITEPTKEEKKMFSSMDNEKDAFDEKLAFYYSYHWHFEPEDKGWGIYYYEWAIKYKAFKIKQWSEKNHPEDQRINWEQAKLFAFKLINFHETYHFLFDLHATVWEIILRLPLYAIYSQNFYNKVLFTNECWEESLANERKLRLAPNKVKQFTINWISNSPPGYNILDQNLVNNREAFQLNLAKQLFQQAETQQRENKYLFQFLVGQMNGFLDFEIEFEDNPQQAKIYNYFREIFDPKRGEGEYFDFKPKLGATLDGEPDYGFSCPQYIVKKFQKYEKREHSLKPKIWEWNNPAKPTSNFEVFDAVTHMPREDF